MTKLKGAPAYAIALSLAVSACLPIPHRHTLQPGAHFKVTDQSGGQIAGAVIHVYEGNIIGGTLYQRDSATTGPSGEASIAWRRKWHLFVILVPDGEAPSVYGWCVDAPGYAPVGRTMDDLPAQSIDAPLLPDSANTSCPIRVDRDDLEHGRVQPQGR